MRCQRIDIKKRKVCVGDLKSRILLKSRDIASPDTLTDYDYTQSFTDISNVWASVQTTSGKDIFDGVNQIGTATHLFYIRYKASLTSEAMVEWRSENYRILRLENLDENNEFMVLYCALRGNKSIEVNLQ
ncbi:MAG: phage head closure protein [Thermoplasmatales archaeon]|nr:MAG: phage head closure protein [Thermoplasmatales archaeon]